MFQKASTDSIWAIHAYFNDNIFSFVLLLYRVYSHVKELEMFSVFECPHPLHFFVSPPFATSLCQGRSPQANTTRLSSLLPLLPSLLLPHHLLRSYWCQHSAILLPAPPSRIIITSAATTTTTLAATANAFHLMIFLFESYWWRKILFRSFSKLQLYTSVGCWLNFL